VETAPFKSTRLKRSWDWSLRIAISMEAGAICMAPCHDLRAEKGGGGTQPHEAANYCRRLVNNHTPTGGLQVRNQILLLLWF
jgi:hypothetical protein